MIEEVPGGPEKLQRTLRDGGTVRPRVQDTQMGLAALVKGLRGTCPRPAGAEVRATVCASGSVHQVSVLLTIVRYPGLDVLPYPLAFRAWD